MSEFPDSIEPLALSVVPDVPPQRGRPRRSRGTFEPSPTFSRVPAHMEDESFCRKLEATVLGELNGGGPAGGR